VTGMKNSVWFVENSFCGESGVKELDEIVPVC
jgi:hypothetical protein